MAGRIEGKVALVTGGASGVGRATVELFVREGAQVVFTDLNADAGASLAAGLGGKAFFVLQDAASAADWDAVMATVRERFGRLDILVNNAGILIKGSIEDASLDDWQRLMRVNADSVFLGCKAAVALMKTGSGGSIINMSSVNAILAIPNIASYVVSKGGVNQLTKVMSLALVDQGIRVNGIGPGSIATELLKKVMVDEAARAKIMSRTPMGRAGDPSEVASVALFLASDDASYLTGQTIYPDGGRMGLNYTVPVKG